MHRSDKHSARADDALDNGRVSDPAGYKARGRPHDDDPGPQGETLRPLPGAASGLPEREVAGRSQLAAFLEPHRFPADRAALLAAAREQDAPQDVIRELRQLPEGMEFATTQDVWEALGGSVEDGP
jgi:hypothetical protein